MKSPGDALDPAGMAHETEYGPLRQPSPAEKTEETEPFVATGLKLRRGDADVFTVRSLPLSTMSLSRSAPRLLLVATLAGFVPHAIAAVYKCLDAVGQTSYQQAPCAGGGGEADVRVPHPSSAEENAARQRGERDKAAAKELEREQETRRIEAWHESEKRKAARQEAEARCAKYQKDATALAQRSQTHGKAHARERDERKAESLRSRHFSECFVAGR